MFSYYKFINKIDHRLYVTSITELKGVKKTAELKGQLKRTTHARDFISLQQKFDKWTNYQREQT